MRLLVVPLALLIGLALVLALVLGPGLDHRYVPGVWVWDVPLSRLTPQEAAAHIAASLPLPQPIITLVGPDGQRWQFSPADLGVSLDTAATLERAYAIGHAQQGVRALPARLAVLGHGVDVPPVLTWDAAQAKAQLAAIAAAVNTPPQDAGVALQDGALRLVPGQVGRQMDISATLSLLTPALHDLQPTELLLVSRELPPRISDEEAANALGVAQTMLSAPLTLQGPPESDGTPATWQLPPEVLAGMLKVHTADSQVQVGLDAQALTEFLAPVALSVQREPVDAHFRFDPDSKQLIVTSPGAAGQSLDVSASISRINEMLRTGEHTIPLVVRHIAPTYPETLTAAELGIREVVAVGESYFVGSSSARSHNIRLGAAQFDGVMVAPGETFSFNQHLGDVTLEKGYDTSYVIFGDRTVLGVGGGICQVATTAFRAAFFGGFPIVERWPHAYRVGYYELGGYGPGFDATVYAPQLDFRFTNDMIATLLIHTEIDAPHARLRFVFYGTPDGRTVEQIGPQVGSPEPPGPPIYEYDPEMPAGSVKQVEHAHEGLVATLGRIVRNAQGQVMYRDTFVSHFRPWPARYLYGPDYTPPPDVIVVTPTP